MNSEKEYEYCLRCGRKLKNLEARQVGYGKVCLSKLSTTKNKPLFGGKDNANNRA